MRNVKLFECTHELRPVVSADTDNRLLLGAKKMSEAVTDIGGIVMLKGVTGLERGGFITYLFCHMLPMDTY